MGQDVTDGGWDDQLTIVARTSLPLDEARNVSVTNRRNVRNGLEFGQGKRRRTGVGLSGSPATVVEMPA